MENNIVIEIRDRHTQERYFIDFAYCINIGIKNNKMIVQYQTAMFSETTGKEFLSHIKELPPIQDGDDDYIKIMEIKQFTKEQLKKAEQEQCKNKEN